MFKALAEAAKRAPIAIMVVTEGEHLRVTIQQRPDKVKDGQIPLSISVAQTPEMLDAELPAAIAEASTATQSAESVNDQVRKQTARAAEGAKDKAEKKAGKKKPAAAPKKAAVKKTKPAAAEKKPPKPKQTPAAKPTKHIASKPTKEQCIAAYHAYAAAHAGEPIKRDAFIKGNPTGRRFERLFGNWDKFIKAAMKAGTLGPADDKKTKPLPLQAPAGNDPAAAQVPADGDTAGTASAGADSHQVESATDVKSNAVLLNPAPAAATGRTVVTTEGKPLAGGMVIVADTGAEIDIPGHGKHRITDFDDKQIVVEPIHEGATA